MARPDIKVIYQDPRTSTPGQGLMLWMKSVYGDEAPTAWAHLAKKTVTVTKGWSEAYGMFLDGEADMVLSYTTSPPITWSPRASPSTGRPRSRRALPPGGSSGQAQGRHTGQTG